jgi:mRNA interferase MazF
MISHSVGVHRMCLSQKVWMRSRTTQRKNPFYVAIPEGEAVTGVMMTDQLRSLDFRARSASFKGECSELLLQNVLRRIKPIIF